ncbi:MAG: hypothetical protein NXH75_18375, partial [Halobacteriovoraceae bacterium]|nr:hypothetical protein [Halobacteriovoraceae bacterium]
MCPRSSLILLFCSLFLPLNLLARQSFEFTGKGNIQVLSDKAYRKSKENQFEAVGNVIITQNSNSIYGEKATLSFATGDTDVVGNVRYIGPHFKMNGSRHINNYNNEKFDVFNVRIIYDNYVVLGK